MDKKTNQQIYWINSDNENIDLDKKAYLYQTLSEIQSGLFFSAQVGIVIEPKENEIFLVRFVIESPLGTLVSSYSSDFFTAALEAKTDLLKQLSILYDIKFNDTKSFDLEHQTLGVVEYIH